MKASFKYCHDILVCIQVLVASSMEIASLVLLSSLRMTTQRGLSAAALPPVRDMTRTNMIMRVQNDIRLRQARSKRMFYTVYHHFN